MTRRRAGILLLLVVFLAWRSPAVADRAFPPDSGIVNVRDYGATGDGRTDDTASLRAAIDAAGTDSGPFFWRTRIVFLPNGVYRVSGTLERRYANGRYGSGMILVGELEAGTVIRLADGASGFSDPSRPKGVVMTTAKLLDGTPTGGGKDYTNKGEGNDAYENFIEDLTVDTGQRNPGAVGIDYLANNVGAIRDVRVRGDGATGIAMTRKWPGPALLQRVEVDGFGTGLAVANTEYGVTLDHVDLNRSRDVGLRNDGNAISAAGLTIATAGTAIVNTDPKGLVALANSTLRSAGGEGRSAGGEGAALSNRGVIVARGVTFDGFPSPTGQTITGIFSGDNWRATPDQKPPRLDDAPSSPAEPPRDWKNVLTFASPENGPPTEAIDITDALRQAFASGAATIYLPYGRYTIHDQIEVPPTVTRIAGMNSSITVRPEREPRFARTTGMFRLTGTGAPLIIERLAFDMTDLGEQLAVEDASPRDVVLRDIVTAGTSLLDRKRDGGRVFIEDACCGALRIAGPAPVIARQLDTEGGDTRIVNDGGDLTVLGLKTEGDCTVLDNRANGRATILGGLLYIVGDASPVVPAFRDAGAALSASFAEESLRAGSHYTTYLTGTGGTVPATAFPPRGYGRIVPLLVPGSGANR